jgi:hypothetical protein
MDKISAVSCSPKANLMDSNDIKEYLSDVFKDDESKYGALIAEQVVSLLKRVCYLSTTFDK